MIPIMIMQFKASEWNPSMTDANSHSQARNLKNYCSNNSINFLYSTHTLSLYLKEKALSKKYLPFLNSFHNKTLSAYFRMWQDCHVQIGGWRFFCFLHPDKWYWEWRETEGRMKEKCKTQWLAFYPEIHASHSLNCFQALAGVHYLQTKFWHMGNLAWSNNAYVPWRLWLAGAVDLYYSYIVQF